MPGRSPSWRSSRSPPTSADDGGVARMSDPEMIEGIVATVTIPVMAKARIGHFAEAQVLKALGVDYVDEVGAHPGADEAYIDKWAFTVPFVCGATNLGEALRRISEGGHDPLKERGRHRQHRRGGEHPARSRRPHPQGDPGRLSRALRKWAKRLQSPIGLVQEVAETGTLPSFSLRRRHRHAGRRGPGPCSWVRRPPSWARASSRATTRPGGQGHRRGDGPLRRARHHRQGQPGPGHRHAGRGDLDLDVKLAEQGW